MMLNKREESSFSIAFALLKLHSGCESIRAPHLLLRCDNVENQLSDLLAIHRICLDNRVSCEYSQSNRLLACEKYTTSYRMELSGQARRVLVKAALFWVKVDWKYSLNKIHDRLNTQGRDLDLCFYFSFLLWIIVHDQLMCWKELLSHIVLCCG